MWTSVVVSVIFGWILLLAVTFAIPSTAGCARHGQHRHLVPSIWAESMSQSWAEALLFICVVAQFFCLTASVTSASRMMFAFSRDGPCRGIALAPGRRGTAFRAGRCRHRLFAAALMIPAVWNYFVGYFAVGRPSR